MSDSVNQSDFDALNREVRANADKQAHATERLTIRTEVMSHDVAHLTDTVADIAETSSSSMTRRSTAWTGSRNASGSSRKRFSRSG